MEKPKRWHFALILAVVILTVYNILPTLFYYAQPLKKPINEKQAYNVADNIVGRVNDLENFTLSWLKAECKNLSLKPKAISLDKDNPRIAYVTFNKPQEAAYFSHSLQSRVDDPFCAC